MRQHVSLDIETFSVDPDYGAAVIAVGAVVFNRDEIIQRSEWLLNPMWTPGQRSESTFEWWLKQEARVRDRMVSGMLLPWEFCKSFSGWCDDMVRPLEPENDLQFWGYPARFDIGHLRQLYEAMRQPFPFIFRQEQDLSTLRYIAKQIPGLREKMEEARSQGLVAHDALSDAEAQARMIQTVLRALEIE